MSRRPDAGRAGEPERVRGRGGPGQPAEPGASGSGYVLGTGAHELARLALQHRVWSGPTRRWIDGLGLRAGSRVVDAGAGPGFLALDLCERVGEGGRVVAVDESAEYLAHLAGERARRGLAQLEMRRGRLEEVELGAGFDAVVARWVLSFPADPGAIVARLAACLVPGGRLLAIDYDHEGVSLFPESEGFRAVVRATRAWYASRGGDVWIAGRLPRLLRAAGLVTERLDPVVICGRPGEPAWEWADAFFPHHSGTLVERGLLTAAERERFLSDWSERSADPDAVFFSPIVAGVLARRP